MHRHTIYAQLTWINKGNDEINHNVKHCIQWNNIEIWVRIGRVTVSLYFTTATAATFFFRSFITFEFILFNLRFRIIVILWTVWPVCVCLYDLQNCNHQLKCWCLENWGALFMSILLHNIYDVNGLTYDLCSLHISHWWYKLNSHWHKHRNLKPNNITMLQKKTHTDITNYTFWARKIRCAYK